MSNAAEMVSTRSVKNKDNRTKGGCYDITIEGENEFDGWTEPSPFIGFRTIMDVSLK